MTTEYKPEWDGELEEMNRGRMGHQFKYSACQKYLEKRL